MFLNHGYAFFAPNPGSSFLLRAHLEFDDGREPLVVNLPDADQRTPRLLYHRYFMLSEHFNAAFPGNVEPVDASPTVIRQWRRARDLFQRREESILAHLKFAYDASEVRLERLEHRQPTTFEYFEEDQPLDAPTCTEPWGTRRLSRDIAILRRPRHDETLGRKGGGEGVGGEGVGRGDIVFLRGPCQLVSPDAVCVGSILVRAARAAHTLLDASFDGRDVALQPRGMEHSTRGVFRRCGLDTRRHIAGNDE